MRGFLLALMLVAAPASAQEIEVCSLQQRDAYLNDISRAVTAVWKVPLRNRALECTVQIQQNFRGEVLNVSVADCGDDPIIHKSVIDAGYTASPMPLPSNKMCFERDVAVRVRALAQSSS